MSTGQQPQMPVGTIGVLIEYAKGQPFNNMLILLLIGLFSGGGYYTLNTAVPAHLKQIESGYERNAATLKDAVDKCCSDRKDILEIIKEQRRANAGAAPENIANKGQ